MITLLSVIICVHTNTASNSPSLRRTPHVTIRRITRAIWRGNINAASTSLIAVITRRDSYETAHTLPPVRTHFRSYHRILTFRGYRVFCSRFCKMTYIKHTEQDAEGRRLQVMHWLSRDSI